MYQSIKTTTAGLLLLGVLVVQTALAQNQLINDGWQFARLSDSTAAQWTAGQQGSDWSSQFNVQYADGGGRKTDLTVADSTLRSEASQLAAHDAWQQVDLPHTAYVEDYVIRKPWQGVCYYKRTLHLTEREAQGQVWLEFEGAMQLADIWMNGRHVAQHAGGFNSFVVDGTGVLQPGDNEIMVRLDNRDNGLIPPGKSLSELDFCYHSGIYRDVRLICKQNIHITHPLLADKKAGGGIFISYPQVSEQTATVRVQTEVANRTAATKDVQLRQRLYEWKRGKERGRLVAWAEQPVQAAGMESRTTVQTLTVDAPRLWHPETPNLYLLRTEVWANGKMVDCEETRIGIRRIEATRDQGCLINGRPIYLEGTNRHQEYPYIGNALSDNAHWRDVWQMRRAGFNTVRLGHYPQDPAVLDACDELGLLVIEPIPGWQFFNHDPSFTARTYSDIRTMIRRDRNHPSILMWETTLNESWPPTEWKNGAVRVAHEEMPGDQCITSGDSYGYSGFDVCYNDWSDRDFSRPNNSSKPSFIREYYDYEFGGHYSTSRITRGDGERALRQNLWNAQWSHNSNRSRSKHTMGGAIWSMYDYNRGCCDNICYSGVADLFRLPKYSLHYYRLQMPVGSYTPDGPMPAEVFVASRWDAQSSDTVIVLGNVAEVALLVNGKEVARQACDHGADTPYTPHPNCGNCSTLSFPPFTFTGIHFRPGELKAVGYDQEGHAVAHHSAITPAQAAHLQVSYFEGGRPAAADDVLIVYCTLTDAQSVICHDNGVPVTLSVEGADIQSPRTTDTEDGIASFIIRTNKKGRPVKIQATSGQLTGKMRLKLR